MTWSARLRALPLAGLTVLSLGLSACGDDDKKPEPQDEADSGEVATTDGSTPRSMDGGLTRLDATTPTTPTTNGDGAAPSEQPPNDGAVSVIPEPLADGAVPVVTTPLATDGNKLSICYAESECNGDDLTCYLPDDGLPGVCTDDCQKDTDCPAIDGIAQGCSSSGQCRVDCSGSGAGDGKCPVNQVCRDTSGPSLLTPAVWRCTYPVGSGKKDVPLYGTCDKDHGGGDCVGALSCHVPTALFFQPVGPGYCSNGCKAESECVLPAGVTSTVMCVDGGCEFDCSRAGATCPSMMSCRDVDPSVYEDLRCRMIE